MRDEIKHDPVNAQRFIEAMNYSIAVEIELLKKQASGENHVQENGLQLTKQQG